MRILVVQLKRLGDLVLTTPVFSELRKMDAAVEIVLAVAPPSAEFTPLLDVDEILVFGNQITAWTSLLRGGFDACLDFTGNDRSLLISALSRAPRRITYSRFASKPFRKWVYSDWVNSDVGKRHTVDHHTDLLSALGWTTESVPCHLNLSPQRARKLAHPFVILHAGTARHEKYWQADRWAEVANWLQREKKLAVVLTGGTSAEEQLHLQQIQAAAEGELHDLSGKIHLKDLAEWIADAALLCSVDSVPIHIADAVRTPVVALFGPTDPRHWRPRFAPCEVVQQPTMATISTDEVRAAMGRLLAPSRS